MKNKTVIVVISIALLLFGYILFVDNNLQTTEEKNARSENVFGELRAEQIDKIELITQEGKVVIAANNPAPGEKKTWRIVSPSSLPADHTELEAMISALDFLIFERSVQDDPNNKQFGLSTPRVKGTIYSGNKKTQFDIGADAPGTNSVYMSVNHNKEKIYVVSSDFLTSMNKNQNELRDKHLIQSELQDVLNIELNNPTERFAFSRNEHSGDWSVRHQGTNVLAAASQVGQLIQQTRELGVQKFVTDNAEHLNKYGLNSPRASITLTTTSAKRVSILVGNKCDKDLVYAKVKNSRSVHCISHQFLRNLEHPKQRYYEKRLLPIDPQHITNLVLKKNEVKLVLSRNTEQQWSATGLKFEDTSQVEFNTLLEKLKQITATEIHWGVDNEGAMPTHLSPLASLSVRMDDQRSQTFTFYESSTSPETVLFQRDKSMALFEISKDVLPLIEPFPLRFRKKVLENTNKEDLVSIDIASAQGTQTLEKIDGKWLISKPEAAATDTGLVKKLLQLISHTPVHRYVMPPSDPFVSALPFARVTASIVDHESGENHEDLTQTKRITIEIGDPFDSDSRYARILDQKDIVFTIENTFTSFLNRPIAARNLLAINAVIINKVSVQSETTAFTATKKNDRWSSEECAITGDALKRILIDFGAAKAIRAEQFGAKIGTKVATVSFYSDKSDIPAVLHFGTYLSEIDAILCRREGLNLTFAIPNRLLKELTAVCP